MKQYKTYYIPFIAIMLLVSCRENTSISNIIEDTEPIIELENQSFSGKVLNEIGEAISGALVQLYINGVLLEESSSSVAGDFTFEQAPVSEELVISVSKSGYLSLNKHVVPDELFDDLVLINQSDIGLSDEFTGVESYDLVSLKGKIEGAIHRNLIVAYSDEGSWANFDMKDNEGEYEILVPEQSEFKIKILDPCGTEISQGQSFGPYFDLVNEVNFNSGSDNEEVFISGHVTCNGEPIEENVTLQVFVLPLNPDSEPIISTYELEGSQFEFPFLTCSEQNGFILISASYDDEASFTFYQVEYDSQFAIDVCAEDEYHFDIQFGDEEFSLFDFWGYRKGDGLFLEGYGEEIGISVVMQDVNEGSNSVSDLFISLGDDYFIPSGNEVIVDIEDYNEDDYFKYIQGTINGILTNVKDNNDLRPVSGDFKIEIWK